jgi:hypothetical protein
LAIHNAFETGSDCEEGCSPKKQEQDVKNRDECDVGEEGGCYQMAKTTMSPTIERLLNEILSSFQIDESADPRRPGPRLSACPDETAKGNRKSSKPSPKQAFSDSNRKRAKAS